MLLAALFLSSVNAFARVQTKCEGLFSEVPGPTPSEEIFEQNPNVVAAYRAFAKILGSRQQGPTINGNMNLSAPYSRWDGPKTFFAKIENGSFTTNFIGAEAGELITQRFSAAEVLRNNNEIKLVHIMQFDQFDYGVPTRRLIREILVDLSTQTMTVSERHEFIKMDDKEQLYWAERVNNSFRLPLSLVEL